jgi:hypothetical protein
MSLKVINFFLHDKCRGILAAGHYWLDEKVIDSRRIPLKSITFCLFEEQMNHIEYTTIRRYCFEGLESEVTHMKIVEIYERYLNGKKFKSISEINLGHLPVKQPADLVGASPIMQELAKRHSTSLRLNTKKTRFMQ